MNNELLTITLLLVIACNLGILRLYLRVHRGQDALYSLLHLVLNRLSEASDRQRGTKQALLEDGKLTRQRIAQEHKATRKETQEIKTRLTWSRKRELSDMKEADGKRD